MIKIIHYPKYNQITIEGHAEAAPKGEDIVCAAVSVLYHTLVTNVLHWKDQGYLMDCRSQERDGYAQVSYVSKSRWNHILTAITEAICVGFHGLAEKYPEHVSYVRMG